MSRSAEDKEDEGRSISMDEGRWDSATSAMYLPRADAQGDSESLNTDSDDMEEEEEEKVDTTGVLAGESGFQVEECLATTAEREGEREGERMEEGSTWTRKSAEEDEEAEEALNLMAGKGVVVIVEHGSEKVHVGKSGVMAEDEERARARRLKGVEGKFLPPNERAERSISISIRSN
jgi:hypothetical protein